MSSSSSRHPDAGLRRLSGKPILRVGIATDGPLLTWQARCLDALAAVPGISLARWVGPPADPARREDAPASRALAEAPIPGSLADLRPEAAAPAEFDSTKAGAAVDILLDLTRRGLGLPPSWAGEVWRYGYGRALSRDPARAALVDYVRGSGAGYVALVDEPSKAIVHEGWLAVSSARPGPRLEQLLLDPADWPAKVARERVEHAFIKNAEPGADRRELTGTRLPRNGSAPGKGLPQPLLKIAAVGRRLVATAEGAVRYPDWNVGIVAAAIDGVLAGSSGPAITWLPTRPGHFAADPFGLERNGILHVFFEDYDQRRGRGVICHRTVEPDGAVSGLESVLDPGVHASYPFLVEHEGVVFMLPETATAGALVLYEAVDFPYGWRPAATLLPAIPAVDASVIKHADRWWMFVTRADRGHNHNLFVFHAPDLFGPWTPHETNPVKTDARAARSGGTPFVSGGRLYRPSQDCSVHYGRRVVVNRVDVLTPSAFAERPVRSVESWAGSPYPDGLHTISSVGDRTLIDGNVRHFVKDALRLKVARRLPR